MASSNADKARKQMEEALLEKAFPRDVYFNVSTATTAHYIGLIGGLRNHLPSRLASDKNKHMTYLDVCRVLPKERKDKEEIRRLTFKLFFVNAQGNKVGLTLRGDNLYVLGYYDGTKWLAFDDMLEFMPVEDNASRLGMKSNYNDLGGLGSVNLGRITLEAAFNNLRRGNDIPKAMLTFIIMLSEAAHFFSVSNHIAEHFAVGTTNLTDEMVEMIGEWTRASEGLYKSVNNAQYGLIPGGKVLKNVTIAREHIALAKGF